MNIVKASPALTVIRNRIARMRQRNEFPKPGMRLTNKKEYAAWIREYLLNNPHAPLKVVDRYFPNYDTWYTITHSMFLPARYGAESYNALVLPGVAVRYNRDIGHGNLLLFDGLKSIGFHGGFETPVLYEGIEV